MNKLFEAFANIFRVPDLRKRVLFTLGLLAVYRLGSHIPTPGIHLERWTEFFNRSSGTIFGFFDLFAVGNIYQNVFVTHEWSALTLIVILAMMVAVVAFIVLVERGERRIPVQYAKRVIGRRVMGGQSTHMPLKVNAGGVIPVIFASSILAFP